MKKRLLSLVLAAAVIMTSVCVPEGKESAALYEDEYLDEDDYSFIVDSYTYLDFADGDCEQSVTGNLRFITSLPEGMKVKWTSSDKSVITNEGKVKRKKKDKKVTMTADIRYKGKKFKKKFPLVVKRKNTINKNKLKDYSLKKLKSKYPKLKISLNASGNVKCMKGRYSDIKVDSWDTAMASLYQIKTLLGIKNISKELKILYAEYSGSEYTFVFNQMYKGIPFWEHGIVVTSNKDGRLAGVESKYLPVLKTIDTSPEITGKEAAKKAEPAGYWREPEDDCGVLVIFHKNKKNILVWGFECERLDNPVVSVIIFVDAKTGEVVHSEEDWGNGYEINYGDLSSEELESCPKESIVRFEDIKPDETVFAVRYENGAWGQQHYMMVVNKEGKCKFVDCGEEWIGDENLLSRMDKCLADSSIPYAAASLTVPEEQRKILTGTKDFALQQTGWAFDAGARYYYTVNGSGNDRKLVCMQTDGDTEYRSRYKNVREFCDKLCELFYESRE